MAKVNNWQDEFEIDPEDEALLRHVMLDDQEPLQGLHQGGYARTEEDYDNEAEYLYPRSTWDAR